MTRFRLSALLIFLLPALIVLMLVGFFNFATLIEFSEVEKKNRSELQVISEELGQTIGFIQSVGAQYNLLSDQLEQANQGELSHAEAYLIHTKIVDDLEQIENQLVILEQSLKTMALGDESSLRNWRQSFVTFKHFALMASDIVAIDPKTSKNFIQTAQNAYFDFISHSNLISNQLSAKVQQAMEMADQRAQASVNSIYWWGVLGLAIALLVAIISAARLSNYLRVILSSLTQLSNYQERLPELEPLEKMMKSAQGELKLLGESVLKFRNSLLQNQLEQEKIYRLGYYDSLTELLNMQLLEGELQALLKEYQQTGRKGALVKLNINRFKVFNNALGYEFGDAILQLFAKRISRLCGLNAHCYRGSGDEFLLLMLDVEMAEGKKRTELNLISEVVQALLDEPFKLFDQEIVLTCNQGLVLFPESEYETAQDIIRKAMIALHKSKELGAKHSVVYEPALYQQVADYFELEKDLKLAIETDQLDFYLQTQVPPQGKRYMAEALIRWNHPTRGMVSPMVFIQLAEQSNLII